MENGAFLDDLRQRWMRNVAEAVLVARWEHERIPREVVGMAAGIFGAIQRDREISEAVTEGLARLGIFGGGRTSGLSIDPGEAMFLFAMSTVVQNGGDPPADPELRARAGDVLGGKVDVMYPFELGLRRAGMMGLWRWIAPSFAEFAPTLRVWSILMAALAVPRQEIAALLGIPERSQETPVQESLKHATAAMLRKNLREAMPHFLAAFDKAAETPEIDDDLSVIAMLAVAVLFGPLDDAVIRRAVRSLQALEHKGQEERIAHALGLTVSVILSRELTAELGPALVVMSNLLRSEVRGKARLLLSEATADLLVRLGRVDEAEAILAGIRGDYSDPDDHLSIALATERVQLARANQDAAIGVLTDALQPATGSPALRMQLAQELIRLWPDQRAGLGAWLHEVTTLAGQMEAPAGDLARVRAAHDLLRSGRIEEARSIVRRIDFAVLEREAPASQQDVVKEVREQLGLR